MKFSGRLARRSRRLRTSAHYGFATEPRHPENRFQVGAGPIPPLASSVCWPSASKRRAEIARTGLKRRWGKRPKTACELSGIGISVVVLYAHAGEDAARR